MMYYYLKVTNFITIYQIQHEIVLWKAFIIFIQRHIPNSISDCLLQSIYPIYIMASKISQTSEIPYRMVFSIVFGCISGGVEHTLPLTKNDIERGKYLKFVKNISVWICSIWTRNSAAIDHVWPMPSSWSWHKTYNRSKPFLSKLHIPKARRRQDNGWADDAMVSTRHQHNLSSFTPTEPTNFSLLGVSFWSTCSYFKFFYGIFAYESIFIISKEKG